MSYFCKLVDRQKALNSISIRDHYHRFSPSQISEMPQVGLEPAQNLSLVLVEGICAVVMSIAFSPFCCCPLTHYFFCNKLMQKRKSVIVDNEMFRYGGGGVISRALLTDLSKAFNFFLHDLLIARLATYGFNYDSLVLIQSYLSKRHKEPTLTTLAAFICIIWCSTRFYTRPTTFQYLY